MEPRNLSQSRGRSRSRPAAFVILSVLTAGAAVLGCAGRASARAIHAHHIHEASTHQETRLGTAWTRFLDGGVPLWSRVRSPTIPAGLILATSASGQLVETPFVDYLSWRRSLNPARFDRYHPILGPELGRLTPPTTTVVTTTPPPSSTSQGGLIPPSQTNTPEPGTIPTALALIAAGLWYRGTFRRKTV